MARRTAIATAAQIQAFLTLVNRTNPALLQLVMARHGINQFDGADYSGWEFGAKINPIPPAGLGATPTTGKENEFLDFLQDLSTSYFMWRERYNLDRMNSQRAAQGLPPCVLTPGGLDPESSAEAFAALTDKTPKVYCPGASNLPGGINPMWLLVGGFGIFALAMMK